MYPSTDGSVLPPKTKVARSSANEKVLANVSTRVLSAETT